MASEVRVFSRGPVGPRGATGATGPTGATGGTGPIGTGVIESGLLSEIPGAGTVDRVYWATDAGLLFLDTGSSWLPTHTISSTNGLSYVLVSDDEAQIVIDGGPELSFGTIANTIQATGKLTTVYPGGGGGEVVFNGGWQSLTSTSHTVVRSDVNTWISIENASPITVALSVPSYDGINVGDRVNFRQGGTGAITFVTNADTVSVTGKGVTTNGLGSWASAIVVSDDEWWIIGDLELSE